MIGYTDNDLIWNRAHVKMWGHIYNEIRRPILMAVPSQVRRKVSRQIEMGIRERISIQIRKNQIINQLIKEFV